jgi:hypothetical protein
VNLHDLQIQVPPNVDNFVSLDVCGVIDRYYNTEDGDGETYCETIDPKSGEQPQFYSVYGRHWAEDFLEAELIDDYMTRDEARTAASVLSLGWGIPITDLANWEQP